MAYKSFSNLTSRNQSHIISQLYKLINYYGSFFCTRERSYLKELSKKDSSIYWLEGQKHTLVASAIVDENHSIKTKVGNFKIFSHTISTHPGQMDRILQHVIADHKDDSLIFLGKEFMADSMELHNYGFIGVDPVELLEKWPELGTYKTSFFNVQNESLASGTSRKQYKIYFKLHPEAKQKMSQEVPELHDTLHS